MRSKYGSSGGAPADFGVDEWFGLNVVMSLTPYGGQCDDEDLPEGWPQAPQSFWYRRHDEFDELPPSATGAPIAASP